MMRSMIASERRAATAIMIAAALALGPTPASAQPAAAAMAEALFKEGKKLLKEGKVPEACRKFEGSYRIDPALGTLLNMALCHEQEGKTATAWGELNETLQLAKKSNRQDRAKIAKEHIAAIEPRLSRFVVAVAPEATVPGLVVEMDGVPLEKAAWGTAIPIDPGDHKAIAKAPKYKPWELTVVVEEAKVATVLVPKLEKVPEPPPPPPPSTWKKPVGIAALGAGAVMLGISGYFGVRALSAGAEVATSCPKNVCDEKGWDALQSGRSAATTANVLIGTGVAVAAVGAVLLLTAPSAPAPASTQGTGLRLSPSVAFGPGGGMVSVGGAF
jgi:hypothetical protein